MLGRRLKPVPHDRIQLANLYRADPGLAARDVAVGALGMCTLLAAGDKVAEQLAPMMGAGVPATAFQAAG